LFKLIDEVYLFYLLTILFIALSWLWDMCCSYLISCSVG